jgi:hypothetical protein
VIPQNAKRLDAIPPNVKRQDVIPQNANQLATKKKPKRSAKKNATISSKESVDTIIKTAMNIWFVAVFV